MWIFLNQISQQSIDTCQDISLNPMVAVDQPIVLSINVLPRDYVLEK